MQADHFIPDLVWGFNNVFLMRNGHPIGTLYGYVEDGFYDNEAEVRADPYYKNATDAKIKVWSVKLNIRIWMMTR